MRAAPAVWAPLDGCGPERVLIVGLHAVTGAALGAWVSGPAGLGWQLAATAGAGAMAGFGVWLARRALPGDGHHLRWDGSRWTLALRGGTIEFAVARVDVTLDLGAWLMLRLLLADGRLRWLPLRAGTVGAGWHGLRVALRAHSGESTGQSAAPPAQPAQGAP